jgi:uncharacterized protein YceK
MRNRILFALALGLALSSCSAEYHLKKACKKNPSICRDSVRIETDTLWKTDTLKSVDTFTMAVIDTIVIDTNGCKLELSRNGNRFKANITSKIPTKTITKTITHRRWVTYTREKFASITTLVKWLCALGVVLILFLAFIRYSINGRH